MSRPSSSLTALARHGFASLGSAASLIAELSALYPVQKLLPLFSDTANPDQALARLSDLLRASPRDVEPVLDDADAAQSLIRILGASQGLAEFFLHHPSELAVLGQRVEQLPSAGE